MYEEGDAVVMDIDTYNRREQMLQLREELLKVEENRLHGQRGYSIEEVDDILKKAIEEAAKSLSSASNPAGADCSLRARLITYIIEVRMS